PIDYIDFEGIIPQGNYGAGTVIVWDTGTYHNLNIKQGNETTIEESIEKGHVEIYLEGEKLRGAYALIRTGREGRKFWLFLKMKDENADKNDILQERPESVLTGQNIEDVENELVKTN
ncbi:MAG: hypothetical protein LLF83_07385, partial [Methanobacterium sp.]|nr:hypothetical protein [Methanobacterium sp.]